MPAAGVGILYVQLGQWPPWIELSLLSAAANRDAISFYYIGGPLRIPSYAASNCHSILFDEGTLRARLRQHTGIDTSRIPNQRLLDKIKDYKPLFPALFPEITAQHAWIGGAELDVLWGDLASEVSVLADSDELLVPSGYFPHPIANGQLVLIRTSDKMIHAYRRRRGWKRALESPARLVFDEYWGPAPSMFDVYFQMSMDGELAAKPTRKPLVQDMMVMAKLTSESARAGLLGLQEHWEWPAHRTIEENATVSFTWRGGKLRGHRRGPCICPLDEWLIVLPLAQNLLSSCSACPRRGRRAMKAASVLWDTTVDREREVLGIHFQVWKRRLSLTLADGLTDGWAGPRKSAGDTAVMLGGVQVHEQQVPCALHGGLPTIRVQANGTLTSRVSTVVHIDARCE